MSVVLALMKHLGIQVTREKYLELAHLGEPPAEISAEEEADLPEHLQRAALENPISDLKQ
jgi:hypothetical protein